MSRCFVRAARVVVAAPLLVAAALVLAPLAASQTVDPASVAFNADAPVCEGNSQTQDVKITLPPGSTSDQVDVFLLFDDTGSFAGVAPSVIALFPTIISDLETALPGVSFGFGVGRFEDYGGPGTGFSSESATGRPFTLNQPIITAADAGGAVARDGLITTALSNTAPGFGGDGPETAIAEGLYQLATGVGFDGNGDGDTSDSGAAGAAATQTTPGTSGDVPAFSSNVLPTSGTLGGAGWRAGAQKIVILATDVCSVAAFDAGVPVPASIIGTGSTEPTTAFLCSGSEGIGRFGFVSDSKTSAGNTVTDAVAPAGAGTVPATIAALNELGVQVIGLGPGASPTSSTTPTFSEDTFLSALARITGAVDDSGDPLVFNTAAAGGISTAIVDAISTATTADIDITLTTSALPAGLSITDITPAVVPDVGPGEMAQFTVTLQGDGSAISGGFDFEFRNADSRGLLGTIPATVECEDDRDTERPECGRISVVREGRGKVLTSVSDNVGIARAEVRILRNLEAFFDGVGPFVQGNVYDFPDPMPSVDVMAERVDVANRRAALVIRFYDAAGNYRDCDPVVDQLAATADAFALGPNAPNPVGAEGTTIPFALAERVPVHLAVYDALGREVAVVAEGEMGPGAYALSWDGADAFGRSLAPGVYVVRLTAGAFEASRRITLVR